MPQAMGKMDREHEMELEQWRKEEVKEVKDKGQIREELEKLRSRIEKGNKLGERKVEKVKKIIGDEIYQEELEKKAEVWRLRRKGLEERVRREI